MIREIVTSFVYLFFLLGPCVVAANCASERRKNRRLNAEPYTGPERRDPR